MSQEKPSCVDLVLAELAQRRWHKPYPTEFTAGIDYYCHCGFTPYRIADLITFNFDFKALIEQLEKAYGAGSLDAEMRSWPKRRCAKRLTTSRKLSRKWRGKSLNESSREHQRYAISRRASLWLSPAWQFPSVAQHHIPPKRSPWSISTVRWRLALFQAIPSRGRTRHRLVTGVR